MRASELASVAFLVLGIQVLIGIPSAASSAIWMLKTASENPDAYGAISLGMRVVLGGLVLFTLGLGIAFVVFRKQLGLAAFPPEPASAEPEAASAVDLAAVALAVAGVWLAVTAVCDAVPLAADALMRSWQPELGPTEPLFVWPQRLGTVVQLAAGVAIFLGSEALARLWGGLRAAGRERAA